MGKAGRRKQPEEEASGSSSKKARSEPASSSSKKAEPAPEEEDEELELDEEVEEEEDEEEVDDEDEQDDEDEPEEGPKRVWRPGIDVLEEGEQLDVEPGTYDMLHRAQVDWPCLSFDILKDDLGAMRSAYPMTAYVVAGTQAERVQDNRIYMMKWSGLHKTSKDGKEESDSEDEDEEEDEDDDDDSKEAVLDAKGCAHPGGVNRIRAMPQAGHIVATWADTGKVHMWNLAAQRKALDKPEKFSANPKPIHTCDAHAEEGYALDFSPHETGKFLSGGNDGKTFLWEPVAGGWNVASQSPFCGHKASVEDVQWKRHGEGNTLFATCSADRSWRVWDTREKDRKKSSIHVAKAHESDVNVLSWSPCVGELIATGSDDGSFKVWDIRSTDSGAMANFQWHRKPVTSIDWHPTDETVLAAASEDNCVSLWDMAVEDDAAGGEAFPGAEHFPPQLLFVHQGLTDPKELKWHPQLNGVCITTAGSGFNIFKTCNI